MWLYQGSIEEIDTSGKILLTDPNSGKNPPLAPYSYATLPAFIFDSSGANLWGSDMSGYGDLFQINAATDIAAVDYFATAPAAVYTNLVAGSALPGNLPGNVYGCGSNTGQELNVFNASSTSILNTYPIQPAGGCGNQMVMDGAGHIFAVTGGTAPRHHRRVQRHVLCFLSRFSAAYRIHRYQRQRVTNHQSRPRCAAADSNWTFYE